MSEIVVYEPVAPVADASSKSGARFDNLEGKVVGFIDNAKPNFNNLVDAIESLLTTQHGVERVLKIRKRAASIPAETAAIDALSAECDLIITGSGD